MLTVAFRIVRTHWFGTVVATVGSLVFFGASLYGDEIRAAFPFYWGPFGGWSVPALLFWAGLIVVTGMLALKNAGDDAARSELVEVTTKVAILVQTLPPKGWRDEYAATVDEAADALDSLLPRRLEEGLGSPELAGIIRNLLGSIVSLAYRFDHGPRIGTKPALYAGNIMLFEGRGSVGPYFAQSTLAALRFLPPEYDVSHLQGVLHLDPELTYSTEREGPDTDVPPIALPVPDVLKAPNGKWRVLPGAPLAFAANGVDGYADVATIATWFDGEADFPGSIKDDVVNYFRGPGAASQSFISRRLTSRGTRLGVLNLHSNRADVLGVLDGTRDSSASVGRRNEFFALMTPFLRELETAVELYRAARDVQSRTLGVDTDVK